jgi:hypothetical protein
VVALQLVATLLEPPVDVYGPVADVPSDAVAEGSFVTVAPPVDRLERYAEECRDLVRAE